MMKKTRFVCLLLACALLFTGCMAAPPDSLIRGGTDGQSLISASTAELAPAEKSVALYFRYGNSAYLAPEERRIQVQRNESLEKALVQALIDGPSAAAPALTPLFPAGTEVLAVTTQDDTLFITFSDAFLGRYTDEPGDTAIGEWRTEGPMRRQLCLDSLAASLTEAGLCVQVQVLVYQGAGKSTSMRLQKGFLNRTGDDTLLPPLTRREDCLLTPYRTASLLLSAWMAQDWASLYDLTAQEGAVSRPSEQTAADVFAASQALTGFFLSPGTVSYDGRTAVFSADLTLRGAGRDDTVSAYPLLLIREGSLWKMDYSKLCAMMQSQ